MSKKIRKRKSEGEEQLIEDWEQKIFPEKIKSEMETMWEIPQIFHFLHLTKEALNLPHLSMYEMERMLLIPRASKQLANIMTSLLSAPMMKAKLRKIPPMPYEFWTNILAYKMKSWFKIYEAKHQDVVKVLETIGVEPEFWNIFPDAPLLNGKDFEELTFKQKIWLLKTICDTVMHTRKTVQDDMAKQAWEDQFETFLGTDRYGARYIYFPQFLNSDLRIYRHCLDNKILSTVTPIKPKSEKEPENKTSDQKELMKKKTKYKRRLSRWSNGLTPKLKKKTKKCDEKKHLNDCKCTSDSATGSLINEDTNLSSTSNCSNNNNNNCNNNHISLDIINVKRPRSSSTCSEISTVFDKTQSINTTRSSGYDTNSSSGSVSGKRSSQRMFKGFSGRTNNNKCSIKIISGILSKLKSGTSDGQSIEDVAIPVTRTSQNKIELNATRQQYLDSIHFHRDGSVDRAIDNLSSISKTDDEKLNEIISAESMKLNDKRSDNVLVGRKSNQVSIISKSDDEKLSETRTSHRQDDNDNSEENRFVRKNGRFSVERKLDEELIRLDKASLVESADCKDLSLSELRSLLQKEAMEDDFSFDEDDKCIHYNLRKLKNKVSAERKQETKDLNEMLLELSVSKFQLVADSVDSLRVLVSTFLQNSNSTIINADSDLEPVPPCEVKLVSKMTELLSSLEGIEPTLRDSTKKARGRLQKEWTNFEEGSVEIQDSSGQGLGSNWWVVGSQGYSLSATGDATLQTLSQSTVSPTGSQISANRSEEELVSRAEQSNSDGQECRESREGCTQDETQRKQGEGDEWDSQKNSGTEDETKKDSSEKEQQTRRVLRARGVSSYTEQFYSDDEIEENELEEWTDVEAVYTTTSTQIGPSTSNFTPKIKYTYDRANEEDSDQDWILPGSRKRKHKRSYANRKLKSFQQKLQTGRVDALQDSAESKITSPLCTKFDPSKPRIKEIQIHTPNKRKSPEAFNKNGVIENHEAVVKNNPNSVVPSTKTTCKVENVTSVHSELDIKDEGPIYESLPCNYGNYYYPATSANYTMLNPNSTNYYITQPNLNPVDSQNTLMQSGPVISSIIPPIQQNYYWQRGQNYFMQNPQSSFVPSQPFHPQGPQMIRPEQYINNPGCAPYMVATSQHQSEYIHTGEQVVPRQMPQNPTISGSLNSTSLTRPSQNRYPVPRQSYPHHDGTVIRSSTPVKGDMPRISNVRSMKNVQQQRNTPVRTQTLRKSGTPVENNGQKKTTSLIMLSDSDDEIEMIVTEKCGPEVDLEKTKATPRSNVQKPTVTSDITVVPTKNTIPPQIIQRMNQGGISIIPIKPTTLVQNACTQLVVVVNETGSHYALTLPNGSKLILTPEQVAQIRASNGGKLVL